MEREPARRRNSFHIALCQTDRLFRKEDNGRAGLMHQESIAHSPMRDILSLHLLTKRPIVYQGILFDVQTSNYIMKTIFYSASERGGADFGWLKAKHSFSFGQWYDPAKFRFGALRVINDDIVKVEVDFLLTRMITWKSLQFPSRGALAHKDSTGGLAL